MTESTSKDNNLHLVKWPFYIGDGLLVLLAFFIVAYSAKPLSSTAISWCVISITFGALVFVAPFVLEYLHSIRLAKNQLQEVVDRQLQSLDTILQELDALSVTLSSLAQKSANSTEKMEQFGFEFKKQFKKSPDRIDSPLENSQRKESSYESLNKKLIQRLESLEIKVSELVTIQTNKATSEVIENEIVAKSGDSDNTEGKNSLIEKDNRSITLIAYLNIDISSTPYVRGEGAGLSWDEGVPMEFVEIGKWQWTVENALESTSCSIFKDDSLAARGDDIVIKVGEKVEVYPKFPKD